MNGPARAFILDDNAGLRRLVSRILSANGFTPSGFAKSADFFAALTGNPPEVVILDLALGPSDAMDVIRHLQAIGFDGKVLLISGHGEDTLQEARRIGISRSLAMLPPLCKPFSAAALLASLTAEPATRNSTVEARWPEPRGADINEAISKHWLELWYQPKFDRRGHPLGAAEALLRLRHPQRGILFPAAFLPSPGDPVHDRLAKYVLQQATTDWQFFVANDRPLRIAVNMPVSVIGRPSFVDHVRRSLPANRSFPGMLVEVAEDEAIAAPELLREVVSELKLVNVHLSIDRVGAGYSDLSRLAGLPLEEVKIDRNVVTGCAGDPSRLTICRKIVEVGHSLRATVCGEGVESRSEFEALSAIGCDSIQGFYFAQPSPPAVLLAHLRSEVRKQA